MKLLNIKSDVMDVSKFEEFQVNNRIRVNRYINIILWILIITGPAIAMGVKSGAFNAVTYATCRNISIAVIIVAAAHFMILKRFPSSLITSLFALLALDALLVYMTYMHIDIRLTWFLVPLLSILFCDLQVYITAVTVNYILMFVATYIVSFYYSAQIDIYPTPMSYFLKVIGCYSIESVIMVASGFVITKLSIDYIKWLIEQHAQIKKNDSEMNEQIDILNSLVEIYDNVNLIDFIESTEMSLRDPNQQKIIIDMSKQTHTAMNQRIKKKVMPDMLDSFLKFTDITTVRTRLSGKKIISADFIDMIEGWFRAQYVTVEATVDGIPDIVIYTTRNVDEEKRREEHLIRLSLTDELTRLYNRRCFEEDLDEHKRCGMDELFVLVSADVNGLKKVNDTLGHAAGDELIKGAASCLALSMQGLGKVYRTGGDEFFAIICTDNPNEICNEIRKKAGDWRGVYSDTLSISLGYASHKENPLSTLSDLEYIADTNMYYDKEKYYKKMGIDRR